MGFVRAALRDGAKRSDNPHGYALAQYPQKRASLAHTKSARVILTEEFLLNKTVEKIKQLAADENVHYIAPAEALKNSEGALPAEAASDGVHMNKKYCKIWLDYLVEHYY